MGSPFDEAVTLSAGLHELPVIEVEETGFFANSSPLMVNGLRIEPDPTCASPEALEVHICSFDQSQCELALEVSAPARGETVPVVRMEMRESGLKVANFSGDHFYTHWNDPLNI